MRLRLSADVIYTPNMELERLIGISDMQEERRKLQEEKRRERIEERKMFIDINGNMKKPETKKPDVKKETPLMRISPTVRRMRGRTGVASPVGSPISSVPSSSASSIGTAKQDAEESEARKKEALVKREAIKDEQRKQLLMKKRLSGIVLSKDRKKYIYRTKLRGTDIIISINIIGRNPIRVKSIFAKALVDFEKRQNPRLNMLKSIQFASHIGYDRLIQKMLFNNIEDWQLSYQTKKKYRESGQRVIVLRYTENNELHYISAKTIDIIAKLLD
jgi:hypothetical protein